MAGENDALRANLSQKGAELRKLVSRAVTAGSTDAVHQGRVATRRFKAALDLLKPILARRPRKAAARVLRRIRRALGPLRDDDVMLAGLRDVHAADPHASAFVRWFQRRLKDQRLKLRRAALERVPAALLRSPGVLDKVWPQDIDLDEAGRTLFRSAFPSQLESFAKGADRFAQARGAHGHGGGGSVDSVHELRIAGKLLRYTLELAEPIGLRPPKSVLRVFKQLQDELGQWHDQAVLAQRGLQEALDERLHESDPVLFGQALGFATGCSKRGQRHLARFRAVWIRRGTFIVSRLQHLFDVKSEAANAAAATTMPTTLAPDAAAAAAAAAPESLTAATAEPEPEPAGPAPSPEA
jgi:CHAD domain-containing protein